MEPCQYCPLTGSDLVCPAISRNVSGYCGWVEPDGPRFHPNGAATLEAMARGLPQTPENPPRFIDKAASLVNTMAQEAKHVVTGGDATVSEEVFQRRLSICRGKLGNLGRCKHLQESPILLCRKCGCTGQIAFRLPVKECPIGRWGAET